MPQGQAGGGVNRAGQRQVVEGVDDELERIDARRDQAAADEHAAVLLAAERDPRLQRRDAIAVGDGAGERQDLRRALEAPGRAQPTCPLVPFTDGSVLECTGGAQLPGVDAVAAAELGELSEKVGTTIEAADETTRARRFGDDHGKLYNVSAAPAQ